MNGTQRDRLSIAIVVGRNRLAARGFHFRLDEYGAAQGPESLPVGSAEYGYICSSVTVVIGWDGNVLGDITLLTCEPLPNSKRAARSCYKKLSCQSGE